MVTRRRILWGVAGTAVVGGLLVGGPWLVGSLLVAPANRDVGAPPADLPVESLTLSSRSGSQVAAWYIPATQAQATVVLVHGIHADRRIMLGRARALHEAGYATLLIDLQAHGESPGQVITLGYLERHDVQAAVELARRREPDHRIGLIGVSMGGAAALLAPELKLDALVLESVYATMDDAIGNRVRLACGPLAPLVTPLMCRQFGPRLGISTADLRPIDHIGRVGCPVMVVTGEDDAFTPVAESRRMYDAAADPKQFVVFEDVGHADFLAHDAAAYRATVLAFLTKHLAPAAE